jgi:hypothetical protein
MNLEKFVSHWLSETPINPPLHACEFAGGNTGLTLYRDDRFQVQLWVFPPRARITDHSHPGLDTWLVRVAGRIMFRVGGEPLPLWEAARTEWRGMRTWTIHIEPGMLHGADIGESGASFLSITESLVDVPKSVHLIWEGPALDAAHGCELMKDEV